jgi:FkbM family methyltransferase
MPNVSYAQNREDVLLGRALPGAAGFYIDVGAADPVELSVTKWFYDRGWSGVNVEPQPGYFAALSAARPRDVNLNALVSDAPREVTFYEFPDHPLLSTPDAAVAAKYRAAGERVEPRAVPAVTLAEVCERHARGPIDFLKIDVEGHEPAVLRGADFTRWRPVVLVVEATEAESQVPNHHGWEGLVLAADYRFAAFDGLNRYYVRAEDADRLVPVLRVPVNLFDEYVPVDRVREREAWERERADAAAARSAWERERRAVAEERADAAAARAAWAAERAAWERERSGGGAARAVWEQERAGHLDRIAWLEGQLRLYRAA